MDLNGPLENMNTTEIEKIFEVIEYVSQLDVSQTQNLLKEINVINFNVFPNRFYIV